MNLESPESGSVIISHNVITHNSYHIIISKYDILTLTSDGYYFIVLEPPHPLSIPKTTQHHIPAIASLSSALNADK